MLVAKLGLAVDYRKISIAQVDAEREAPPAMEEPPSAAPSPVEPARPSPTQSRIEFIGVSVAQSHLKAEARVEVALEGVTTVAAATGADSSDSVMRLVAEATLEAVQRFYESGGLFAVSSVEQCTVGGKPIVVVSVSHVVERHERPLVGACPINGDVPRATVLATLDAINRFLWRLVRKEPTEYEVGPASEG